MNNLLNEKYAALANALQKNINHIVETKNLNFTIMEQEFARQGYRDNQASGVEKILIFRLDYMGDFILSTPAIREIRANYPAAFITLLINKAAYPMAELCPYVNEVIPIDVNYTKLMVENDVMKMLITAAEISAQNLWQRHFTMCICLRHGINFLDLFLNYLSGAKERIGHVMNQLLPYTVTHDQKPADVADKFLTLPIIHPKEVLHTCAKNLYILKAMGLQIRQTNAELWYDAEDLYTARNLLEGFAPGRLKIIVGVGANDPIRKYPAEKYLAALKEITQQKKGGSVIIVGGSSETEDAKFLEENLPKELVKNIVAMKMGWRIDAAIMSLADMYIGNDTGASQVAAACHLPAIVVNSEAKDKIVNPFFRIMNSPYTLFYPWQTNAISIRPEHALGDCQNHFGFGGCAAGKSHCIAQIEPREIVDAYNTFAKLITDSKIQKTSCPPITGSTNQVSHLYYGFTHL